jgi:hypothetical protein
LHRPSKVESEHGKVSGMNILLPYAERRNSMIVAKICNGGGGKMKSREVDGRPVTRINRIQSGTR